jgi:hypothetical protein
MIASGAKPFCPEIRLSLLSFVLRQGGASKQKDNFIGLSGAAQMFAGGWQEMVRVEAICKTLVRPIKAALRHSKKVFRILHRRRT